MKFAIGASYLMASLTVGLTAGLTVGVTARAAWAELDECYALDGPQNEIAEMVLTDEGDLTYTRKNQPLILYFTDCGLAENDTVRCSIDCDGGNMSYTHSAMGIQVDASGIRIEAMQFDSLLNGAGRDGADGASLSGQFFLKPARPATCQALNTRVPEITLRAGDVHPFVASLERNLVAGGYLLGGADTVFDARTSEAVRAYQGDAGLAQDGLVDRALMRRLGVEAMMAFGGC